MMFGRRKSTASVDISRDSVLRSRASLIGIATAIIGIATGIRYLSHGNNFGWFLIAVWPFALAVWLI
jgi:hypothetical protein